MRYLPCLLILACHTAYAATYTASTCSRADVATAIAAQIASAADGDVIVIPAGSCTWTGTTAVTGNFTTSVTIQGAGAVYATDGGASTAGSDQTTILDNINHSGGPSSSMTFTIAAGKSLRITGLAITTDGSSTAASAGLINVSGTQTSTVRVDHCHFVVKYQHIWFGGATVGVVDHNYFQSTSGTVTNDMVFWNGATWNGYEYGDGAWADDDHWGTSQFMFVEDNRFYNGGISDAHYGARFVLRHNTVLTESAEHLEGMYFWHGVTSDRSRSARAAEVYANTFTMPGTTGSGLPTAPLNGGTLLYWGNTITQYLYAVQLDYTRKDGASYNYGSVPTGWGNCTGSTGTVWDGTGGYPCLDGPGRGIGNLLSGYPIASTVNTRTSTQADVQQALSPIYVWGNTFTPAGGYSEQAIVKANTAMIQQNREFYVQFGTYGESGSFDGTKGIGSGAYSSISATCTVGVGYWATDRTQLYVCTTTNTWTSYYAPYTYPHPLQGAAAVSGGSSRSRLRRLPPED